MAVECDTDATSENAPSDNATTADAPTVATSTAGPGSLTLDETAAIVDTIAAFLAEFSTITGIERDDSRQRVWVDRGFNSPKPTRTGSGTFWIFVTRDDTGALTVTERARPPR